MQQAALHIAIFCRAAVVGHVKTRLIPDFGAAGATFLYAQLVERTLATVHASCRDLNATASLWVAGDCTHASVQAWSAQYDFPVQEQCAGDLGQRMADCLVQSTLRAHKTLLIGTDCPAFTDATFAHAAAALTPTNEWVFVPAHDGGYVLVGSSNPSGAAAFHKVDWGSARVMAQTRAQLQAARVAFSELPALWDVDEPQDVYRAEREGFLRLPNTRD